MTVFNLKKEICDILLQLTDFIHEIKLQVVAWRTRGVWGTTWRKTVNSNIYFISILNKINFTIFQINTKKKMYQ